MRRPLAQYLTLRFGEYNLEEKKEPRCEHCGTCCHYYKGGALLRCKHLVRLQNGKTLCRIYKTRLGTLIDKNEKGIPITCHTRESCPNDYVMPDGRPCPYNDGKPLFGIGGKN